MAKVGRASTPVDLMTYQPEDEQPSVFFLREGQRQSILTVFNWTNAQSSHTLKLTDLGLPAGHTFAATNVLQNDVPNHDDSVALVEGAVRIENQPPQSVKVIKIIDTTVAKAAPTLTARVPSAASAGETIHLSAQADPSGVPAVSYHWDFDDGTKADGPEESHAYTRAGTFSVRLTADGVDGVPAEKIFPVKVTGRLSITPNLSENRRFVEPTDH